MFEEAVSGNRCCSEKLGDRASQDRNRSGDSVDLEAGSKQSLLNHIDFLKINVESFATDIKSCFL